MTLRQLLLTTTLLGAMPFTSQAAAAAAEASPSDASRGAKVATVSNPVEDTERAMAFATGQVAALGKAYTALQGETADLRRTNKHLTEEVGSAEAALSAERSTHADTKEELSVAQGQLDTLPRVVEDGKAKFAEAVRGVGESILDRLFAETDLADAGMSRIGPRIPEASSIQTVMGTLTGDLEKFFEAYSCAQVMVNAYTEYCNKTDRDSINDAIETEEGLRHEDDAVLVKSLQSNLSRIFTVSTVEDLQSFDQKTFLSTLQQMQEKLVSAAAGVGPKV